MARPGHVVSLLLAATVVALSVEACGGDDDEAERPRPPATSPPREKAEAGPELFEEQGCDGCHTLAAANSSSSVGPNLDKHLERHSKRYIREAIVDPNAEIAHGFKPGVMPDDFGKRLSRQELDQLVDFLANATR